jgi:hypothetical protein
MLGALAAALAVQVAPWTAQARAHARHVPAQHAVEAPGSEVWSRAMNRWQPHQAFDTCSIEEHNNYRVRGPDSKWYPTWHAPLHTRADGTRCAFGHEHGRNPRNSLLWRQVQEAFYFDANQNAMMDPSEEAATGIPFGYANEQLDAWSAGARMALMRHEDHVGHKIDYANGEPDLATHRMSDDPIGGVWIGRLGEGVMVRDTGVRCFFLTKVHQGVHSPDAFTNNVHEVFYFSQCAHPQRPNLAHRLSIAVLAAFGRPGGFTSFQPLGQPDGCSTRRSHAQDFTFVGLDEVNANHPTGLGDREIIHRECVETGFLVRDGRFSGNFYEAWPVELRIERKEPDRPLVRQVNLLFDVEDASRYFYPEALKRARNYTKEPGTNLGRSMDLCYEVLGQRRARGGACDGATRSGSLTDITWDDPRSAFRGLHRGHYFMPGILDNAGGPEIWYTDPFGRAGSREAFPGAIRQVISARRLDYSSLIGIALDPRVTDRIHDDGGGTVHAPN